MWIKPKEIKKCPLCGGKINLVKEKRKHIPAHGNFIIDGLWWVYKCEKCGEGFTSTESDEISLKQCKQ